MTNKIGKILFRKIFIWYTLIAIILTSYQIYSEYLSFDKELRNSLHSIEMSFKKSLTNAIWNLDEEQINLIAESIIELNDISGIFISDSNGSTITKLGKVTNIDKAIIDSFNLNYKEETIAKVILYSSKNIIFNNMKDNVFLILVNALLKSFILLILVYYFSNKIITQIIHKLTNAINNKSLSTKEKISIDELSDDSEIYTLIKSFNNMNDRLEEEIQKNKEKDLHIIQQSKTIAISELIGNIAHQWRQPLSIISAAATGIKIQKDLDILSDEDEIKAIDTINKSAQYLSRTIEDFRNYLEDDAEQSSFDISKVLDYSLNLFSSRLDNSHIKIIKNYTTVNILGNKHELIQVLINILNNSKNAHENITQSNKYIFISIEIIESYVQIKIKDNAGGIKDEIIDKIFEPYFTTKHKAQGTGLSLFISNKIIKDHMKGNIFVENQNYEYNNKQYRGACFTITLKTI